MRSRSQDYQVLSKILLKTSRTLNIRIEISLRVSTRIAILLIHPATTFSSYLVSPLSRPGLLVPWSHPNVAIQGMTSNGRASHGRGTWKLVFVEWKCEWCYRKLVQELPYLFQDPKFLDYTRVLTRFVLIFCSVLVSFLEIQTVYTLELPVGREGGKRRPGMFRG